jgi:hypothetical protein
MTPLDFLRWLWGNKPMGLYVLIWTRQDKRSHWFRDLADAAEFVTAHDRDVYVGVGVSESDYGQHHRCLSEKVMGLAGFWADFDLLSEAHSKKPLPATPEEALTVIPTEFPPTMIVSTGNGVHAWWLFTQPWIFADDEERKSAEELSYRFQTLLMHSSNQRGWAFDRLGGLARVLRVPGTTNAKDPNNPKDVEIYSVEGRRYEPSEFRGYLDDLAIPDAKAEEHAAKRAADSFVDQPLEINFEAAVPDEKLAQWEEQDWRFHDTWTRQRHDLHDQSQSGYDMALADFGVTAGLADQDIVNLIIHHRRLHGQVRRTRVDYYQRTISKAKKVLGPRPFDGAQTDPPPTGNGDRQMLDTGITDVTKKALLCQKISQLLGIGLLRIVKLSGKEPMFLMELAEGRIEFPDVGKLISQNSMRLALAGKVGKIMPTFKPGDWRHIAQMLLDACVVRETTDDLELEGEARIYVRRYLSGVPFIESPADHPEETRYRPMVYEGKLALSSTDMQLYLNRTMSQTRSVKSVAAMLAALGAESVRVRPDSFSGDFKEQSRWSLPIKEFDPNDYLPQEDERGGE